MGRHKRFHETYACWFFFVWSHVQHLHALAFGNRFQTDALDLFTFAAFHQYRNGIIHLFLGDKIRSADQQLPSPVRFWRIRKILPVIRPPLSFQLADGVILPARELARHFYRERDAIERSDARGEDVSPGSALALDRQITSFAYLHQCRLACRRILGLMLLIEIDLRLWHHSPPEYLSLVYGLTQRGIDVGQQVFECGIVRTVEVNLEAGGVQEFATASRQPLPEERGISIADFVVGTLMGSNGIVTAGDGLHAGLALAAEVPIHGDAR